MSGLACILKWSILRLLVILQAKRDAKLDKISVRWLRSDAGFKSARGQVPRVWRRRFGLQHDQKQTHLRVRPGQRPIRSVPNLALAQNPALKMNA